MFYHPLLCIVLLIILRYQRSRNLTLKKASEAADNILVRKDVAAPDEVRIYDLIPSRIIGDIKATIIFLIFMGFAYYLWSYSELPAENKLRAEKSSASNVNTIAPQSLIDSSANPVTKKILQSDTNLEPNKPLLFLDLTWPVRGNVIFDYNPISNQGVNIAAPLDTHVQASEDGTVVYAYNEVQGYGHMIIIRHHSDYFTVYAHLGRILVNKGQEVKRGETIGAVGKSGGVHTPQLRFELRHKTTPIDPNPFLD
jgi:murein DD-endopeptidase MepM/ murein hydrolase activator NlpD